MLESQKQSTDKSPKVKVQSCYRNPASLNSLPIALENENIRAYFNLTACSVNESTKGFWGWIKGKFTLK